MAACGGAEIEERLAPSEQGVSFAQLRKVAQEYGFAASLKTLTREQLFSDHTAVLWIEGDHFIAVDPRERDPASESS